MTTTRKRPKPETNGQLAARNFPTDTAEHVLTIHHDTNGYRHLLCKKPGTSMYWFEVTTHPGVLTIAGDMGTYVFRRDHDMFEWIRRGGASSSDEGSYDYWASKLVAVDARGRMSSSGVKEFSKTLFREWLIQDFWERRDGLEPKYAAGAWKAIRAEITKGLPDNLDGAVEVLNEIQDAPGHLTYWGYDHSYDETEAWFDYSFNYLWCARALVWTIREYDRQVQAGGAS